MKIAYVSAGHFRAAWDRYRKYSDQSFSFTDVTSFVVMEGLGITKVFTFKAFSFDSDFARVNLELLA